MLEGCAVFMGPVLGCWKAVLYLWVLCWDAGRLCCTYGSCVGMLGGCDVLRGPVKGVEYFAVTVVVVQVLLFGFIISNYIYITNIWHT
jgi:hypothetical protein